MPRGSLRHEDAQQTGSFIKEGTWDTVSARVTVQQYTGGEKYTAVKIVARPLTSTFEEVADGEEKTLNVVLGKLSDVHPGHIDPKSFYDQGVEPEDLGVEVGTEGNSVYLVEGKQLGIKWSRFEQSLRKCGIGEEITKLGVLALFDGLKFHCTTVETGGTYTVPAGQQDEGKIKPYTQVLVDRIQKPFPWEKQESKAGTKTASKSTAAKTTSTTATSAPAATSAPSSNGVADWAKIDNPAKYILEHLKPEFFEKVPKGEAVGFDVYTAAIKREMLRHKPPLKSQKEIQAVLLDAEKLAEIAVEIETFQTDGETIEFVS